MFFFVDCCLTRELFFFFSFFTTDLCLVPVFFLWLFLLGAKWPLFSFRFHWQKYCHHPPLSKFFFIIIIIIIFAFGKQKHFSICAYCWWLIAFFYRAISGRGMKFAFVHLNLQFFRLNWMGDAINLNGDRIKCWFGTGLMAESVSNRFPILPILRICTDGFVLLFCWGRLIFWIPLLYCYWLVKRFINSAFTMHAIFVKKDSGVIFFCG